MRRLLLAAVLLALAAPGTAAAAPSLVPVGDFSEPVHVAGPPGDAARLFVVEKPGRVRLVRDGATTTFLDVTAKVEPGYERGLLSIAFPHDYTAIGRFYVFLTAKAGAYPGAATGDVMILEGRRSAQDPDVADPALRPVLRIPHPAVNHNGGQLAFGPDGALYASVGDGASDPSDAQDRSNFLGKILRFPDPRTDAAPAIWAWGLRNPWRFSFDRVTSDVTIGDVGAGTQEEINWVPFSPTGERNFGWPACEGTSGDCGQQGFIAPAVPLPRNGGEFTGVIGGFVARDPALPTLVGRYLFSDLGEPESVRVADLATGAHAPVLPLPDEARSFGEDGCGRLHVATATAVHRIEDPDGAALARCVVPPAPPAPGPGTPAPAPPAAPPGAVADSTPCALTVNRTRRARVGRIVLRLRADEACRATVRARGYRARTVQLAAGTPRTVTLKLAKRSLLGREKLRRTVRVSAVDAAGNVTTRSRKLTLRKRAA